MNRKGYDLFLLRALATVGVVLALALSTVLVAALWRLVVSNSPSNNDCTWVVLLDADRAEDTLAFAALHGWTVETARTDVFRIVLGGEPS